MDESDPYWQIRAGLENLAGSPIARPDTWSWSPVPGLFYPNSPGWNFVLAAGWEIGHFQGLFVVSLLSIATYLLCSVFIASYLGVNTLISLGVGSILWFAVFPMLSPRGTIGVEMLLLVSIFLGYVWTLRAHRRSLFTNAVVIVGAGWALCTAGNWIHLSWTLYGFLVAGAMTLMWCVTPNLEWQRKITFSVLGFVAAAAGLLTGPYGFAALARTYEVRDIGAGIILEWSSPFTNLEVASRWAIPSGLALLIVILSIAYVWRTHSDRNHDPRLRLVAALTFVAVPFALLGLTAIRFVGVALLFMVPLASVLCAVGLRKLRLRIAKRPSASKWLAQRQIVWFTERYWQRIIGITLAVLLPFVVLTAAPTATQASMGAIRSLPSGCQLFTLVHEANLTLLIRPDVPVWYDGRADYFGRQRLLEAQQYAEHTFGNALVPPGTSCVLLENTSKVLDTTGLIEGLSQSAHWTQWYRDENYTVWVPSDPQGIK